MRTKKLIFIALLSALLLSTCSKSSESTSQSENQSSSNPTDNNPSNSGIYEFPEITIIDLSSDSEWDYIVMGLNDYYYLDLNSANNFAQRVLLHSNELNKDFLLNFNDNGLLNEIVSDNYIALFRNFNVNLVDVGVILDDGSTEIYRGIDSGYNWQSSYSAKQDFDWALLLRLMAEQVEAAGCIGGLVDPNVFETWGCRFEFNQLTLFFAESNDKYINPDFRSFVETTLEATEGLDIDPEYTWYDCFNMQVTSSLASQDCVEVYIEESLLALADYIEKGQLSSDEIQAVLEELLNESEKLTYIPDDNFEQALIDLGYDDDLDDYVLTENIDFITALDISNKGINDLIGIEDFSSLTLLNCGENQILNLDLQQNTELRLLHVSDNPISVLDVSQNLFLTELSMRNLEITALDLSANLELKFLFAPGCQLTSINITENTKLESLYLDNNSLTNVDLTKNINLKILSLYSNPIQSLDLSQSSELVGLDLGYNNLTGFDISNNLMLESLSCINNPITSLDISQNTLLSYIYLSEVPLTCVKVNQQQIDGGLLDNLQGGEIEFLLDCN